MIKRLREREENRSVIKHIRELIPGAAAQIRGRDVAVLPFESTAGGCMITTSAMAVDVWDAWDEAMYRYICSGHMPRAARVRIVLDAGAGEAQAKEKAAVINGLAELGGRKIQILSLDVVLSNSLDESLTEVTFLGESAVNPYDGVKDKKSLAGRTLVCVGNAGAYGSRLLVDEHEEEMKEAYGLTFSEIALMRLRKRPKAEEVLDIIRSHEGISIVKACGYGGVYGGLWQLSQVIGTGLNIRQRDIPVLQETVETAEHFDQNPYMLHSAGAWIIVCAEPEAIIKDFVSIGIPASCIGTVSEHEACLVEESGRHLTPVEA